MREVVIGMEGEPVDLIGQQGDFWFHTDGVFLLEPPRWIVVQVIAADSGGAFHVLDLLRIFNDIPPRLALFGLEGKEVAAPLLRENEQPQVRYRKDYMRAMPSDPSLDEIHSIVRERAKTESSLVGVLKPGNCVIVDNWRFAHRREAFQGRRTIRRLWLTDSRR